MSERDDFIATCDAKLRLVRTEADLTQEQMAFAIGISKKTLVDIEKGRRSLGWAGAVAMCSAFPASDVLTAAFKSAPLKLIPSLARGDTPTARSVSSASPWWEIVAENDQFIIEQNTISQHYRLLRKDRSKVAASFDMSDLIPVFSGQAKEIQ